MTPAPADAVARGAELADVIARDWPGFNAPVPQVWCVAPNDELGLCGTLGQQHCAGSVARVWHDIGLVPGVDFPRPHVYCPAIAAESDAMGCTVTEPQPGDGILIDWEGDGVQDHDELVVDVSDWPTSLIARGWNTDETGHGLLWRRTPDQISRIIRPLPWHDTVVAETWTPTTNEERVVRWLLDSARFSPAGVAGIAGNIQQESSFDPAATEKAVPLDQLDRDPTGATAAGYGLCQWSFARLWDPATGLLGWCDASGLDPTTINAQLAFMAWEIDQGMPGLAATLATATDPVLAAQGFGRVFEGWGIEGARNQYAAAIYERIMAGDFGPLNVTKPTTESTPAAQRRRLIPTGDHMATLIDVHADGNPSQHLEYWLAENGAYSRVDTDGITTVTNVERRSITEHHRMLASWGIANGLTLAVGDPNTPVEGLPVFPPVA